MSNAAADKPAADHRTILCSHCHLTVIATRQMWPGAHECPHGKRCAGSGSARSEACAACDAARPAKAAAHAASLTPAVSSDTPAACPIFGDDIAAREHAIRRYGSWIVGPVNDPSSVPGDAPLSRAARIARGMVRF